ncbi:hypothetical protein V1477_014908 [Vespula maculifrons]|uniref:Uncharacterized protein n=1 Tax=Vespula maculifrons TaxID=7453 RepID=A0ABD2BIT5_VESMC
MSTYLIFNQLQIIHPQFRPKSRSSVLEPSQNFLSNTTGRVPRCLKPTVWTVEQSSRFPVSPWVPKYSNLHAVGPGSMILVDTSKFYGIQVLSSKWLHDRSCLEMFEADGVDSGAICKRGFIHLQFAEKPEAPEAERHLGSRILE